MKIDRKEGSLVSKTIKKKHFYKRVHFSDGVKISLKNKTS